MQTKFTIIIVDDDLARSDERPFLADVGIFRRGSRGNLAAEATKRVATWCRALSDRSTAEGKCVERLPAIILILLAADEGVRLLTPDLPSGSWTADDGGLAASPFFQQSPPTVDEISAFTDKRTVPGDWNQCERFAENVFRLHRVAPLGMPCCILLDLLWLPQRTPPVEDTFIDVDSLQNVTAEVGRDRIKAVQGAWARALVAKGSWERLPAAKEGLPLLIKRSLARDEEIPKLPVVVATQVGFGEEKRGAVEGAVAAGADYAYAKKDCFQISRKWDCTKEVDVTTLDEQRFQDGLCTLIGSVLTVSRRWAAGKKTSRPPDTGSLLELAVGGSAATPSNAGALSMAMLSDVIFVNAPDKELVQLVLEEFLPPPLVEWVECTEIRDLELAIQRVTLAGDGEEIVVFAGEELFLPVDPRLEKELTRLLRLIVTRNWGRPFTKPVKLVAHYRGPVDSKAASRAISLSELGDLTAVPEPLWRAQAEVIRAVGEKGLDRARIDLDLTLRDPSLLRDRLAEIVQEWLRSSLIARGLQG